MIPKPLLLAVVMVEALCALAGIAVVLGHGLRLRARTRHDAPMLARGRAALAVTFANREGAVDGGGQAAVVEQLPQRIWTRLLDETAPSLWGERRARLGELAESLGLAQRARRRCRSRRWWRRLDAAHRMALYGLELPETLLSDRDDDVRAQALEWAGDHPTEARIERLIDALDDPSPLCRATARDSLMRVGPGVVEPAVRRLAGGDRSRIVGGLMDVAAWRPDPRYQAVAVQWAGDGAAPHRAAGARLLGALGGDVAVGVLIPLLDDDDAEVRGGAAAALGRLGHWPAARLVAPLLRDPAWDVRRAAGNALAAMGAPGHLVLRRWTGDDDPFAAAMARRVLELDDLRSTPAGGDQR